MSQNWNDLHATFLPDSALDFLPSEHLRKIQLQRLKAIVALSYAKVPLIRSRMDAKGVRPDDIRSLEDIRLLPFMQKTDLRDSYPYGLFATGMEDIVRLHASSGTTGKPIVVAYTEEDMRVWASTVRRAMLMYGLKRGDILQNAYGYGLFTGGLGVHAGAESLGCTVVPVSGGNSERQINLMRDFGVTAFAAPPSYFIRLIDQAHDMGVDLKSLSLRVGIFGAEPWTEEMRAYIERHSGIKAYDIYGLSEIAGPGVGAECQAQQGIHIFEDHYYPEIVDPKTGEALPDGEEGELVLTTLSKRAMPILRYRTHDLTSIIAEPCSCGRVIRRIRRICRRSDDMLIIRGVNVFPSQVEAALMKVEECTPHYRLVLTRKNKMDNVTVEVEIFEKYFGDSVAAMEAIRRKIQAAIMSIVSIRMDVKIVEPHSIERSEGKAKRVIDRRNEA